MPQVIGGARWHITRAHSKTIEIGQCRPDQSSRRLVCDLDFVRAKQIAILFQIAGAIGHGVLTILVECQGKGEWSGDAVMIPGLRVSLIDPKDGNKPIVREQRAKRFGRSEHDGVAISQDLEFTGAALALLNVIVNHLLLLRIQSIDFLQGPSAEIRLLHKRGSDIGRHLRLNASREKKKC